MRQRLSLSGEWRVRSAFLPPVLTVVTASCVRSSPTPAPLDSAIFAGCYRLEVSPPNRGRADRLGGSVAYIRLDTTTAYTPTGAQRLRAEWLSQHPRHALPEPGAPTHERERAELRAQLDSLDRSSQYWRATAGGDSLEVIRGTLETGRHVYSFAARRDAARRLELVGTVTSYSDDTPREADSVAPARGQRVDCPAPTSTQ